MSNLVKMVIRLAIGQNWSLLKKAITVNLPQPKVDRPHR